MNAPSRISSFRQDPTAMGESAAVAFRLVVAPSAGRFRHLPPVMFHEGDEWVAAGQPVAVIEQGNTSVTVESPIDGRLAGILVRDGEPVLRGQPLVWLDGAPRPKASETGEPTS